MVKRLRIDNVVAEFLLYLPGEKLPDFFANLLLWSMHGGEKEEDFSFQFHSNYLLFLILRERLVSRRRRRPSLPSARCQAAPDRSAACAVGGCACTVGGGMAGSGCRRRPCAVPPAVADVAAAAAVEV